MSREIVSRAQLDTATTAIVESSTGILTVMEFLEYSARGEFRALNQRYTDLISKSPELPPPIIEEYTQGFLDAVEAATNTGYDNLRSAAQLITHYTSIPKKKAEKPFYKYGWIRAWAYIHLYTNSINNLEEYEKADLSRTFRLLCDTLNQTAIGTLRILS
ncbi:hypothetical protein HY408_00100 [Candidatus Gottesmanbacteria bacterium]|nr:hypothetical protein [Candidatus Gottesmanbacteria bacterium]